MRDGTRDCARAGGCRSPDQLADGTVLIARYLMYSGVRNVLLIGCAVVACLVTAYAQGLPGIIENYYPAQFQQGQTTTLSIAPAGGRGNALMTVEFTPAAGITVGTPKGGDPREGII